MTRAPSAILVVRHGARLDAADRNWHLTSPAPYDPPLTYGGWNQAKALGVRIANILNARIAQQNAKHECASGTSNGQTDGATPRAKKQKVVIHTSPFLRCLQTSVAIAAGMAQSLELPVQKGKDTARAKEQQNGREDYSVKAVGLTTPDNVNIKTILRVDAFLGEWLSPDYFEGMTPPPSSTMMIAAAKATLLRKEQIEVFQPSTPRLGHFPGGWSKASVSRAAPTTAVVEDDTSVDNLFLAVPLHKQRSNSANGSGELSATVRPILSQLKPTKAAYDPPIPAYAVAPSDPIPRGYCGHARDACIDLDLLWDSMRFPQDWGDGGELGEEWSAMHKRFRKGLTKMVEWYTKHTPEFHPDREDPLALDHETDEADDDDYDLTVILVTHAAGCNALVGALTNQPVLHDFGLTSLSMAVRKETGSSLRSMASSPGKKRSVSPSGRRRSSVYLGTSDDYEMQIVSSTNHLRAGARATEASALASPHLVPHIPAYASLSHTPVPSEPEPKRAASTALGSIRRPSITPSTAFSFDPASPSTISSSISTGLWSRASTISSTTDDMPILSIGAPAHSQQPLTNEDRISRPVSPMSPEKAAKAEDDEVPPLPVPSRTLTQHGGLWNAGDRRLHTPAPKRRWTVTEHDQND